MQKLKSITLAVFKKKKAFLAILTFIRRLLLKWLAAPPLKIFFCIRKRWSCTNAFSTCTSKYKQLQPKQLYFNPNKRHLNNTNTNWALSAQFLCPESKSNLLLSVYYLWLLAGLTTGRNYYRQ